MTNNRKNVAKTAWFVCVEACGFPPVLCKGTAYTMSQYRLSTAWNTASVGDI